MYRGVLFSLLFTLVFLFLPRIASAQVNLVPNPSLETVSSTNTSLPLGWDKGYIWGDLNATYSYQSTGYNSAKSVKTTITRFVSGDAKWFYAPVTVTANKQYLYSDYYQSSVQTEIVVQLISSSGAASYQWLSAVPANTNWTKFSVTFTPPSGTVKASVFHIINKVGYLALDNVSLSEIVKSGIIPNPSVENPASSSAPLDWQTGYWGSNQPIFRYLNTGQNGSRSVQVELKNYQNGDAKWFFAPQVVQENKEYQFSDYYFSTVDTRVIVWAILKDGTNKYIELRGATASKNWTKYIDTFVTPTNLATLSVFHLISANGVLTTDNYLLEPVNLGSFKRGLISLTFDDGSEINYRTALPLLNKYNYRSTQFYATEYIAPKPSTDIDRIKLFLNSGHEVGSHSVTHPDLTTLTLAKINSELGDSKIFLEKNLTININNFASPYGAYNDTVVNSIKKYYRSHRSVDPGFNTKTNFDPYRLKVQNILKATTASEVRAWADTAQKNGYWLILVYHRIDDQNVGPYDTTPTLLDAHLIQIQESGVTVTTVNGALNEIAGQI